ncbi:MULTISPECIES: MFS transporter [Streptomyces]|uniref:Major facilitator superfamily (MFS) profile domain-containing protein n=1 Tax=Streptomyces salyersiae TaxID=3075530 RepID=A0ABU2REN1_9ACTN|nr:hypothetical protein [Streptomyces sp. DSM 41770]MDT0427316.1 hypothetical protein [Streptomyces sp. DSM 41770]
MVRTTPGLVLVVGLVTGGIGALLVTTFDASTGVASSAAVIGILGIGIALATAPITTIAVNSLPPRLAPTAGAASSALRQIGSALGPAVFGVLLTNRTLSTLPGHLAASDLGTADRGQVLGMVSDAGIQPVPSFVSPPARPGRAARWGGSTGGETGLESPRSHPRR